MNERIRELAEQAIASLIHKPFSNEQFHEKFAELIILECAKIASHAENDDNEFRCMHEVITNHFGS